MFSASQSVRRKRETVSLFARQLATLVNAGAPLMRSLQTLERQQSQKSFKRIIHEVGETVRGGGTLSDGLARFPRVFDPLFLNMVRAGEAGGILDTVLVRVAGFLEKSVRIRKKLQSAMVYPAIVITVSVAIVGFLMAFVIPRFQTIFETMLRGQPLPPLTRAIVALSEAIKNDWLSILVIFVVIVAAFRFASGTAFGRRLLDPIVLRLPVVGELTLKIAVARFSRTFGTLMASSVPVLEALRISRDVAGNSVVQRALDSVHDAVRDGDSIGGPMDRSGIFPPMVSSMVEVGEETGRLPEMMERVADEYDNDVDNSLTALTSVLEPMMIVVLAVVVGTIVIALFLPIVTVIQSMAGH